MEMTIRVSMDDYKKLDINKAMDGEYIDINLKCLLISMHSRDGAIDDMMEKAEKWDNLPEDIQKCFQ